MSRKFKGTIEEKDIGSIRKISDASSKTQLTE